MEAPSLKGMNSIAVGERFATPTDRQKEKPLTLKGSNDSIPEVSLVVLDPILLQQLNQFFLKRLFAMMLLLIRNV